MAKKRVISEEHRERLRAMGFKKGQSGNPKGRPVEDEALKGRIRQKLPLLIDRLEEIAYEGKNEASVVKAIETMLSYVMPKATTRHEHKHEVDVTGFGDFLIEANRRRQAIEAPKVIEGNVVEIGKSDFIDAELVDVTLDDETGQNP